jgi:hypothetical protein
MPSIRESISIGTVVVVERFFLAFSAAILRRLRALGFSLTSLLYFFLISAQR